MQLGRLMQHLIPLLFLSRGVGAFVYSCEEVKYKLINSLFDGSEALYACVVVQEGYTNYDQLKQIGIFEKAGQVHHADKISQATGHCITKQPWSDDPWRVMAPADLDLDCSQEFTVFFTSDEHTVYAPVKEAKSLKLWDTAATLVVPQTGIKIKKNTCTGTGDVKVYTGVGKGTSEQQYELRVWNCTSMPDWILTFDSAIAISADLGIIFEFEYSNDLTPDSRVTVSHGDRITIFTNGKADDLQNLQGGIEHRACIALANAEQVLVTANMQLTFDTRNSGAVVLQKIYHGSEYDFYNGTHSEKFKTEYFEVRYVPSGTKPNELMNSRDNIFIDISIDSDGPSPSITTSKPQGPTTTTKPSAVTNGQYCDCTVDKFGFSDGWNSNEIWLDVVVVLDTSEAMGAASLDNAQELVESFISDGIVDFLITDPTAPYYTRVGVIAMSDTAEVLYNLNLTKADNIQVSIKKGLSNIDINKAFVAATSMLTDGLKSKPDRSNTRQVIYYMTDSDTTTVQNSVNIFKETGVIVVNNFLKQGEPERPVLKQLASDGYYYSSTNYLSELQSFCKANCFCSPGKSTYAGTDPATQASGGCYHAVTAGVPFNKAKTACANGNGILATVHDDKKGPFVQQLISDAKSDYFWIGYEKSSSGAWEWEDQSTDPYTNWDVNEPSSAAVAKCAYVDTTSPTLPWGAGNCQLGFPYACQYAPCSVGNKNC